MSTAMGKEGKEEGVPGCKVQSTGDYGPPRRGEEGQSSHLREEGLPSLPATAQCGVLVSEIRQSWAVACKCQEKRDLDGMSEIPGVFP